MILYNIKVGIFNIRKDIMKKIALSLLLVLGFSSNLIAKSETNNSSMSNGFYIGAGGTLVSTGATDSINLFDQKAGQDRAVGATLLFGYSIREFLDIEARFMKSVAKEDAFSQTTWGVFLKPKYEVFNGFSVYGLYGVGGVSVSPEASSEDFSITDISIGGGASYKVTSNISVFADYVDNARHNVEKFQGKDQQVDTKSITTGLMYNF